VRNVMLICNRKFGRQNTVSNDTHAQTVVKQGLYCETLLRKQAKTYIPRTHNSCQVVFQCHNLHKRYYEMESLTFYCMSLDSSAGTATVYGLRHQGVGVRVPVESRFFSCTRRAGGHAVA
jgi:hypothetical protein